MNTRKLIGAAAVIGSICAAAPAALAQDDDAPAITARVHATFVDKAGGAGVLSGDMVIVRFEVRNGSATAIGRIVGALADSSGTVLGRVNEELAMTVSDAASTCNQLRMQLSTTDADILGTRVHFDGQTAGFDSRDGTTPKALRVLCTAGDALRSHGAAADRVRALNDVAIALKTTSSR